MVISIVKTISGILIAAIFLLVFFFVFNAVTDWQAMTAVTGQLGSFAQAVESARLSDQNFELTLPSVVTSVKFVQKSAIPCVPTAYDDVKGICWESWMCRMVSDCPAGDSCVCNEAEDCCSIDAKNCVCFYDRGEYDYCVRKTNQKDAVSFIYVNFRGKSPICVETKNPMTTTLHFYISPEYTVTTTIPDQDSYGYPPIGEQPQSYVEIPPQLDGCYRYGMTISTKYSMTAINIDKKEGVCGVLESVSDIFK